MPIRACAPVLILAVAALACDEEPGPAGPVACTEEYRSWMVSVVDTAGSPVDGLQVVVDRAATGDTLPYGMPFFLPGSYLIMDDGMVDTISIEGETIRAAVSGPAGGFVATWVFGADAWRCHVEKKSGPDTVVVAGDAVRIP